MNWDTGNQTSVGFPYAGWGRCCSDHFLYGDPGEGQGRNPHSEFQSSSPWGFSNWLAELLLCRCDVTLAMCDCREDIGDVTTCGNAWARKVLGSDGDSFCTYPGRIISIIWAQDSNNYIWFMMMLNLRSGHRKLKKMFSRRIYVYIVLGFHPRKMKQR